MPEFRYVMQMITRHPSRLLLTAGGISLCILLMLFLYGIYSGVSDGSVDYIRNSDADLWVLQENSTNILRGTSILSSIQGDIISTNENIESCSPILFLLVNIKINNRNSTIFLTGYDPLMKGGAPVKLARGRNVIEDNEIVVDRAFAKINHISINDRIFLLKDTMVVKGISEGTNAFVIQYAFTTISKAQSIIHFPGLVSAFQLKVNDKNKIAATSAEIKDMLDGAEVYTQEQFLNNNIREMKSGFLPIIYAIALLGAVVLTIILSLILSISIIEKKKDFAVLKIIGAPIRYLPSFVIIQSISICTLAIILAVIFYYPVVYGIEFASPEVSTKSSFLQFGIVISAALLMAYFSSLLSINKLKKIYPLEVFYD